MFRSWVLAYDSVQQLVWPSWNNIHHLYVLRLGMLLAGFYKYVVAYVHSEIFSRPRHRSKICHRSHLCSRSIPSFDSWGISYAVANVDSLRNHVRAQESEVIDN
jgi:hypothetical protein